MRRRSLAGLSAVGAVLVLCAVIAVLLVFPRALAPVVLVALVGYTLIVERMWPDNPRLARVRRELRTHVSAEQAIRVALLVVAAAEVSKRLAVATALAGAVLMFTVRLVPRVAARMVAPRYLIAHVPGAQERQDRKGLLDAVSAWGRDRRAALNRAVNWLEIVVAAAVTAAVLGLDDAVAYWVVVVTAAVVAVDAVLEVLSLVSSRLASSNLRFDDTVVQALATYQPEFILYFSAAASGTYQINQWLPHLINSGRRFVVITRENVLVEPIAAAAPGVPVISSPRLVLLDQLVVPSIRAVFYVNNGMRNAHMLRHTHLRHVQMLHGESDKAPSVNKFARAYDQLYVAGQAAVDRYELYGVHVDPAAIRIIGRPQADGVSRELPAGRPTVLYAPTWEGWNSTTTETSVGLSGVRLVQRLLERGDVRVIVRPHPTTGMADRRLLEQVRLMRDLITRAGGDHVFSTIDGDLSLVDCFNQCTIMIADISSVMADFLRSEKALIVTDVDDLGDEQFHESYPTSRAAWVLRSDAANLDDILDDALGPDSYREQRVVVKHYVLGDFDGPAEPIFHAQLAASIDEALRSAPRGLDEVSD